MCPFCLASVGLMIAGATSASGLTALAVKLSRKKKSAKESISNSNERSNENVNSNSR